MKIYKKNNFYKKFKIHIFIFIFFFILLLVSFATIRDSFLNKIQYQIFNHIKMPFSNLYFMNYKLSFPDFFAIDFFIIILILLCFFVLYLKKINVIKNWDDFTDRLLFFIIVFVLYFFLIGLVLENKFIFLQLIFFISLLLYFIIYSIYTDVKKNINLIKNNYLIKNEFLILIIFSLFVLFLNIHDYKSWKYSYIGDEWAFFEYAHNILNGKVNLNIFSEAGVYGYHPVLSSIWQAFIMFITDRSLFGWKLSSSLIVPFSIIPFYIWNKMIFNRTVAIIATVTFSFANAMIAFSHIGYNNIQTIFFYVTTLCFLEIALRKKSSFYLTLTSIIMGLGFYTFYSSRLMIILVIIYIILHPEKKKFKIFEFILPLILYFFIITPIILQADFLYHLLRQSTIAGSEIQKPEERPIYVILNFIHSFFAFLTKNKNTHFMIDGLTDIFSAIGILFGFIWIIFSFKRDWRSKFLLISYILLIFCIGALQQYHYPVNTRLIFLIPILSTISGVGFSRLLILITYFKRSKQLYLITLMIICFIIFIINYITFYIKMPQKIQFTMQAYILKFLQKYEKFEKVVVLNTNLVYLDELIKIYKLDRNTYIYSLNQFESVLKQGNVNKKVIIFDSTIAETDDRISRLAKSEYIYRDNVSKKILFYIYDFTNDNDYYNGFYELWTTGKTNYKIKLLDNELKRYVTENIYDKDTIKKIITYKKNNKTQKYKLSIYKNFQFEKTYKSMKNMEIKNYKLKKISFDNTPEFPSDIAYDDNLDFLFIADSANKKILKFSKEKEDNFKLNTRFDIPGKLPDERKEITNTDILFLTIDHKNQILYILDSFEGKIYEINYDGRVIKEIVQSDFLKYSTDIVYSEQNKYIIVNNPEENMIILFNTDGDLINIYSTTRGIGEGQMNRPVSSELVNDNYLLVSDSLNGRVQLFDKNFKYIKNYRIGVCSRTQWPDILYFSDREKPYFMVTQPVVKKIFIFLLYENVFWYIDLMNNKEYKFLNPSKIAKSKKDIYMLDNFRKFIVRLQLPENFVF